jgi:hypothetical protein
MMQRHADSQMSNGADFSDLIFGRNLAVIDRTMNIRIRDPVNPGQVFQPSYLFRDCKANELIQRKTVFLRQIIRLSANRKRQTEGEAARLIILSGHIANPRNSLSMSIIDAP